MLMNLRGLATTDTGMSDTEIEMSRLPDLQFGSRFFTKGGKRPDTSTMTDSTATSAWTQSLQTPNDELGSRPSRPAIVSFAPPIESQIQCLSREDV